jgi:SagB-type dehydrogenase family enzyme
MTNKKIILIISALTLIIIGGVILVRLAVNNEINNVIESVITMPKDAKIIELSKPKFESEISIEEALVQRRSIRDYKDESLTLSEVSQLLWAAQGITIRPDGRKGRTAPSAGATYPLEIYLTVRDVEGLEPGVYRFLIEEFKLKKVLAGNIHPELSRAALGQPWVAKAPINIVIGAVYERTTDRYGERGIRYVHMEVGHVGQNISLQVISLELGTVVIGAFDDNEVKRIVNMAPNITPLYIMPVGRPR